jgi:hypothetical protein
MLKLAILTMKDTSHAETDIVTTFQPCKKLLILTKTHSRHVENLFHSDTCKPSWRYNRLGGVVLKNHVCIHTLTYMYFFSCTLHFSSLFAPCCTCTPIMLSPFFLLTHYSSFLDFACDCPFKTMAAPASARVAKIIVDTNFWQLFKIICKITFSSEIDTNQ